MCDFMQSLYLMQNCRLSALDRLWAAACVFCIFDGTYVCDIELVFAQ